MRFPTKLRLKPKATPIVSATVVTKRPLPPHTPIQDHGHFPHLEPAAKEPKKAKPPVPAKTKRPPEPVDPRPRSERVAETLTILQAEFPALFPETEADVRPFAIGIRKDLWTALKKKKADGLFRSRALIGEAIALYREQHPTYAEQLKIVGTPRIGIDGLPKGSVTEAEAALAKK